MFENFESYLKDTKRDLDNQQRLLAFDLDVMKLLQDLFDHYGDRQMVIDRLESLVKELKVVYPEEEE